MSTKEDELFKKYLEDLKAEIPAEKHSHLDALADVEAFKEKTYRGTLRKDEFHRRLNDLESEKKKLEADRSQWTSWWETEKPKNERLMAEKQELERKLAATLAAAGIADPDPQPSGKGDVTKQEIEELRQQLKQAEQAVVGMNNALPHFLKDTLKISHAIVKNGYDIDPAAVLDYSMQHRVTPQQAFDTLKQAEDDRRREADVQKRIEEAKEAARREALSSRPTPDFVGRAAASPVLSHLQEQSPSSRRDRVREAGKSLREMLASGETLSFP